MTPARNQPVFGRLASSPRITEPGRDTANPSDYCAIEPGQFPVKKRSTRNPLIANVRTRRTGGTRFTRNDCRITYARFRRGVSRLRPVCGLRLETEIIPSSSSRPRFGSDGIWQPYPCLPHSLSCFPLRPSLWFHQHRAGAPNPWLRHGSGWP
jgi:hypothetical protein